MNGIVLYYPYRWQSAQTYAGAVDILQQYKINATWINDKQNIVKTIHEFSNQYEKVLFLSHIVIPFEILSHCIYKNVFCYTGQTISKNQQLSFLESKGISVSKYLTHPLSLTEVQDELGNKIVIKPNEVASYSCKLVKMIDLSKDVSLKYLDRWLYTQYVGERSPPYWKSRVTAFAGHPIFAYILQSDSPIISAYAFRKEKRVLTTDEGRYSAVSDEILNMGCEISRLMSKYFGCGIVGVDIIGNNGNLYAIECNPTLVSLSFDANGMDSRFKTRAEEIALACKKQIDLIH